MSITSTNAIITLSQPVLFPSGPVQLEGFAVDDVWDFEKVKTVEELMGVDGVLSFGFVWVARRQNIMLQADSASNDFFDTLNMQQEAAQDVYPISGSAILAGIATKFTMINGALTEYTPVPAVKRTLMPRSHRITWNRVIPSPQ